MIEFVRMQSSVDTAPLQCFEVGVPVAAQAVGLTAACEKVLGSCHCARVIGLMSLGSSSAMTVLALPTMSTRLMSAKSSTMRGAQFGAVSSYTGSLLYAGSHLYAA